jgi:hypothetical protein
VAAAAVAVQAVVEVREDLELALLPAYTQV